MKSNLSNFEVIQVDFQRNLDKLISSDTRELAFKAAEKLIKENESKNAFKIFYDSLFKPLRVELSDPVKECDLILMSFLSQKFQEKFIYPKDKKCIDTIQRAINYVIKFYFTKSNDSVKISCGYFFGSLYKYCSENLTEIERFETFYDNILKYLSSGRNQSAFETPIECLKELISITIKEGRTEELYRTKRSLIKILKNVKIEISSFWNLMETVLSYFHIYGINPDFLIQNLLAALLKKIDSQGKKEKTKEFIANHVAIINFLSKIAEDFVKNDQNKEILADTPIEIIKQVRQELINCNKFKNRNVQIACNQA